MIKINLVDFLTRRNFKELLLNILESENCNTILQQIKDAGATTEFLTQLNDTFDDESDISLKFFTEGVFENLMEVFEAEEVLAIFGLTLDLPGDDSPNDFQDTPEVVKNVCGGPELDVKENVLTHYFDWHTDATFDILGNNAETIAGRLINGNTVEVYCHKVHPILKLNGCSS